MGGRGSGPRTSNEIWRDNEKLCPRCKTYKKFNEYGISNSNTRGINVYCKACKREYEKEREKKTGRSYNNLIGKLYGIDIGEYKEMLNRQGGVCAVCSEEPKQKRLCVDHDHNTGEIRGLLCNSCNYMLGNANDSIEVLRNAIKYLKGNVEDLL